MVNDQWSNDQKLEALMALPWTLKFDTDSLDGSLTAEVAELPEAIATGKDTKELAVSLYDALNASLASRLEHDDPIDLPPGCVLPWHRPAPTVRTRVDAYVVGDIAKLDAWTATTKTVTAPVRDLVGA
jgi:predicted RNase H-like HicB family nuclease